MKVGFLLRNGKLLWHTLLGYETVGSVTAMLSAVTNTPSADIAIACNGRTLAASETFDALRAHVDGQILTVENNARQRFFVQTQKIGLPLYARLQETVRDLKVQIEEKWKVPHTEIILYHNNTELEDGLKLAHANVKEDDILRVILRPIKIIFEHRDNEVILGEILAGERLFELRQDPDYQNESVVVTLRPKL